MIEKIYQTLDTAFDRISKHLKTRKKYSAARRIFNSFLSARKCDQTLSLVFDILLEKLYQQNDKRPSYLKATFG